MQRAGRYIGKAGFGRNPVAEHADICSSDRHMHDKWKQDTVAQAQMGFPLFMRTPVPADTLMPANYS